MTLKTTLQSGLIALLLLCCLVTSSPLTLAQNAAPKVADQALDMTFNTRTAFPGSFGTKNGQQNQGATLDDVAGRVISLMLQLLATVGIAICIFGSFRMITSLGNSGALKKGQDAFMNAAIGTIIIIISYVIVAFVQDLILQVK